MRWPGRSKWRFRNVQITESTDDLAFLREIHKQLPYGGEAVGNAAEAFMKEVMEAGEFGRTQADRMVAMRGTGPAAYLQEFQHQMHLNYPRAGRIAVLWPLLCGLTLARFLYNNRRLHRAPVRSILKKAGRRSELTEQMQLFQ